MKTSEGLFSNEIHMKGWGREEWIINEPKYCGKLLYFNAGKKFSWHFHKIKEETFHLLSGKAELLVGLNDELETASVYQMSAGDSFHIAPKTRHQIVAITDCLFIELSTQHFENDSYRIRKGD